MAEERSFVSEPPDEYICFICSKVMRDPQLTDCCGQHFCLGCLQQWFKKHGAKQCPHCRSAQFTYIVYLPLKRKIDQLDVYCSNKTNGCQVVTSLSKLEAHIDECEYAKVRCEQGCECVVLRKHMQDHRQNVCPKRITNCSYCSKAGPYDEIVDEKHTGVCPDFPIGCPKKCSTENSDQIKRKDLKVHEKICPLELVPCLLCNEQHFRYTIQYHRENLCLKRQVKCQYCATFGPHNEINGSHIEECGDYPVKCPRGCKDGEKLKRKELEHHATECELEPVKCAFFDVGCRTPLPRKDLKEHMESNTQTHLQECLELQLAMAGDYQKLMSFFTELKGKFDILRIDHEKLKDEHHRFLRIHNEMKSSISIELDKLVEGDTQKTQTTMHCIKTVLSPNLTDQNPLVFQLHRPPYRIAPITSWSSCPILIEDTYKVKLKLEIQNESRFPAKGSRPARPGPSTVTTTFYFYRNHCGDADISEQSRNQMLDMQKEIHIEIKSSNSSSRLRLLLCTICRPPPKLIEIARDAHDEMEAIAKMSTQIQARNLSDMIVQLNLHYHPCEQIYEKR